MSQQKHRTKRETVESRRRVTPREARHVGAPTVQTQVAGSQAARLWCLCSACGARVVYLYEAALDPEHPPEAASSGTASTWLCRACCGLVYTKQQQHGTRQAWAAWMNQNPARVEKLRQAHPATRRFWRMADREHARRVAVLDWDKASDQRREELLEKFGGEEATRAEHRRAMCDFWEEMHPASEEAGRQVLEDLWRFFKSEHRSRPKPRARQQPCQVEVESAAKI